MENNSINIERIIDRFDKYMFIRRLNDNKVTNNLHFSVGTIGKSRKKGRDLSRISIEKILNFYTDLNPVWLNMGIGVMLKEPDNEIKNSNMKTSEIPEEKMKSVPVMPERQKKLEASHKRMQEVVDDFQMNVSELERHLKITHSLIFNILDERNAMTRTVANALAKKPHNYSYKWLMYGTLPKFKPRETHVKIEPNEKKEIQTSECKGCIDKKRIIDALDRIIKLLEEDNEKLRKSGGVEIQKKISI